ncbi:MAG: GTP-binding protein Obg [Firmicutes bacterium]|nr:GTP-binding protein Obg [Bacillota bacterium]
MFVDVARIHIIAGNGGHGAVAFRREKYVPAGGPSGGDGGRGGDIVFEVDAGMRTLMDYRYKKQYKAENGENGGSSNKTGKDGEDLILKVPPGTVIKDEESGRVIADLASKDHRLIAAKGGRGGRGNSRFTTSTRRAPTFAENGAKGEERKIILELKLLADVGLIGFPNVGKSTLLSVATSAKPKIADYHFTTITPNLGVVELEEGKSFVLADIPGLIEGAHRGAGLGHDFLRHIERTRVLIHVLDASGIEGRDPVEDFRQVNSELERYNAELAKRPQIVAANKTDIPEAKDNIGRIVKQLKEKGYEVFEISAAANKGIVELMHRAYELLSAVDTEEQQENIEQSAEMRYYKFKEDEPYRISKDGKTFVIKGDWIESFMENINIEQDESLKYFQKTIRKRGIIDELKKMGIDDGDTVRIGSIEFEYYE